jgi:hypothetical protein
VFLDFSNAATYSPIPYAPQIVTAPLPVDGRKARSHVDTHFVTGLLKHGKVQIVIAEIGINAEPVVVEMMAVIASQEGSMISRRIKDALAAAKARGVKLGGWRHDAVAAKGPSCEQNHYARCSRSCTIYPTAVWPRC